MEDRPAIPVPYTIYHTNMESIQRRAFAKSIGGASLLTALGGAQVSAQQPAAKIRLYRFEFLYMQFGDQGTRLAKFYESQMPLLTKHISLTGIFNSQVSPRNPTVMIIKGYTGYDHMLASDKVIQADPGYQKALVELEKPELPPYDSADSSIIELADFSPDYVPLKEKPATGRIFELRFYRSATERQHGYVKERFAGRERVIFHRVGIDPILMGSMVVGQDTPNWVYLTPFTSLAEREKAWDAFAADPEWVKVRADSIARGGQIVSKQLITLYRAAPYSQIQ
jgi:hypothetical protein